MLPCLVNSTRCPFPTIPSSQRNLSVLNIPTFKPSNLQRPLFLTPFPATLTISLHLIENTANLNPTSANLDATSTISPLFATLTQNTRGWGYRHTPSPLLAEYFLLSSHPPFANSFRIRTYKKKGVGGLHSFTPSCEGTLIMERPSATSHASLPLYFVTSTFLPC